MYTVIECLIVLVLYTVCERNFTGVYLGRVLLSELSCPLFDGASY